MSEHTHILPISAYLRTYFILLILMVLTIVAALLPEWMPQLKHLTVINNIVAMTIATIKAVLVILFFMGVKYSSRLVQMFAALGFVWFTLMFITLLDYGTRGPEAATGWEGIPSNSLPRVEGQPGT